MDEAMPLLALLLLLGGKKKEEDPNKPNNVEKCNQEGLKWSFKLKKCVPRECPTGSVRDPKTGLCIQKDGPITEPEHPDEPWKNFPNDDIVDDYPTDGKLLTVKSGMVWSATGDKHILHNVIAQRAYNAKIAAGASHQDALSFGTQTSHNQDNRSALFAMIMRDPWNDAGSATYGGLPYPKDLYDTCTHRTIRLIPQYDNVIARLASGLAPRRYMALKTPADVGKGNAYGKAGGKQATIWIPLIDEAHLLATGLVRAAAVDVMPAWIRELGWLNLPGGVAWGC